MSHSILSDRAWLTIALAVAILAGIFISEWIHRLRKRDEKQDNVVEIRRKYPPAGWQS